MADNQYNIRDGVLISFNGDCADVVIPPEVTRIESMVFFAKAGIRTVMIHGGVKVIGQGAFFNCDNLQTAVIGSGVEVIETFAFRNCTALKRISLPSSVKEIQPMAFDDDIVIDRGGSVTVEPTVPAEPAPEIPEPVVTEPTAPDPVPAPEPIPAPEPEKPAPAPEPEPIPAPESEPQEEAFAFDYYNNGWVLKKCLFKTPHIEIPQTYRGGPVVGVGALAFAEGEEDDLRKGRVLPNTWLESVTFPETCKVIGDKAFVLCKNLTSVGLQEGLERIGAYAFMNCTALSAVWFPSTCAEIGEGAFMGCEALCYTMFPKGLRKLGNRAFKTDAFGADSGELKTVAFSFGVTLGEDVFPAYTEVEYCFGVKDIPAILRDFIRELGYQNNQYFRVRSLAALRDTARVPAAETVILARDNTVTENGKRGWVMTERGIYQKELMENPQFFGWEEFIKLTGFYPQNTAGASILFEDEDHKQWASKFKLDCGTTDCVNLMSRLLVNFHQYIKERVNTEN